MGSGEFYDRLEPLPPTTTAPVGGVAYPYQALPTTPPAVFSHFSSLYDETALGVGTAMGGAYSPYETRHASSGHAPSH